MPEYKLPDVGEGLTEADIVAWRVKVGDTVKVNDVVVEIETAKSVVELPSPYAGEVTALMVEEGETVVVGTPIIRIGEAAPAAAPTPAPAPAQPEIDPSNPGATGGGEGESLVGRAKAEGGSTRRKRKATGAPAVKAPTDVRALAKPPVRKLAKDLGVDLQAVVPTGDGGTVTRDDVLAATSDASATSHETAAPSSTPAPTARPSRAPGERETREPIKGVRKAMGQAMVDSAFSAPHVTVWKTLDVTCTMELVERLKSHRELRDVKVTPLLVVAKAVLLALGRQPLLNSTWDEAAGEVVLKHYVNLGIAAATPRGLVVPNIKDADGLGLRDLAVALGALTATAREGRTSPADMAGGSFTITNVGVFGMDAGTPILNPGESGILAVGAIERRPWVVGTGAEERIEPRHVTTLAISFDHRHVDGETGSRFLADVAAVLEDPSLALMF
ncbi:dihydrolipoamide acetyltransferase family protein [Nocardioides bruguierae]|uniref:Dihydrolipoamide acetyltransferase component of pyruvate dehydrogenase complex n=1 Tax=Nocardioides bruguierae TaxID=2945102 RepID=A0A9X2IFD4_9ACTN|nr:dihydrolipoamide acetyltransferase family protein [Nocardioides bruguierae]MCM0620304.1 2-oxo acid dehydrogenase subunit E2 [Nocardioides bruguierae]